MCSSRLLSVVLWGSHFNCFMKMIKSLEVLKLRKMISYDETDAWQSANQELYKAN